MATTNERVMELDDEGRRVLEYLLVEFDQQWTENLLAERLRELAPDSQLRLPALVEMVKIDMERQWQRGRLLPVEEYLARYPELGAADGAPADLIQAEYEVRHQFGRPADLSELAQRFPQQACATARRAGTAGCRDRNRFLSCRIDRAARGPSGSRRANPAAAPRIAIRQNAAQADIPSARGEWGQGRMGSGLDF